MALQRDYRAPEFGTRDTREIQRGQVAQADTRSGTIEAGDSGWKDRFLVGLAEQGAQLTGKMFDTEIAMQYLEGAAQAGIVKSEEELQTDPITSDWKIAGYRDNMGKLALAEQEAKFMADLPLLAEQDPEQFQQYLGERRQQIAPVLAGMSREARANATGQLALQDRASISKHTAAHHKFVTDQQIDVLTKQNAVNISAEQQARALSLNNPEKYGKGHADAMSKMLGDTYAGIWANPRFTYEEKQALTFAQLQGALKADAVAYLDVVRTTPLPDNRTGGTTTIWARLEQGQQNTLMSDATAARERSASIRNFNASADQADVQAQIAQGTFQGSLESLTEWAYGHVRNGAMSEGKWESIRKSAQEMFLKRDKQQGLSGRYQQGDINGLANAGADELQGRDALIADLAAMNATPQQYISAFTAAGNNGMYSAFQALGKHLSVAVRQMRSDDGQILTSNLSTIKTIMGSVKLADIQGKGRAKLELLSSFQEPADRMLITRIMDRVDSAGWSYDEAAKEALKLELDDAKIDSGLRSALAIQADSEIAELSKGLSPQGWFDSFSHFVGGVLPTAGGQESRDLAVVSPESPIGNRGGWFSDSPNVVWYNEELKKAVGAAATTVKMRSPNATGTQVFQAALGEVARNTITVPGKGKIYMPSGVDLQAVFGVAPANQVDIGPAIGELLHETKSDSMWRLRFYEGRVFATEMAADGKTQLNLKEMPISPQSVQSQIAKRVKRSQDEAVAIYGTGAVVRKDGVNVTVNGLNTAGVRGTWMADLRNTLVRNEGVTTKVEDDTGKQVNKRTGRAVQTGGVGLSDTNDFFPKPDAQGRLTEQQINESFQKASDQAAYIGLKAAEKLGRPNQKSFVLFSEIAYQSGGAFLTREDSVGEAYRNFGKAFQGTSVKAAQEAFKKTAAWQYSGSSRRGLYLARIEQAMRGQ